MNVSYIIECECHLWDKFELGERPKDKIDTYNNQ